MAPRQEGKPDCSADFFSFPTTLTYFTRTPLPVSRLIPNDLTPQSPTSRLHPAEFKSGNGTPTAQDIDAPTDSKFQTTPLLHCEIGIASGRGQWLLCSG